MVDESHCMAGVMDSQEVRVSCTTKLSAADIPGTVFSALQNIFPEVLPDGLDFESSRFPNNKDEITWSFNNLDLEYFLHKIHEDRVLDTALDAMSQKLQGKETTFELSRQAAINKKISFCLLGENPLGGTFVISLQCEYLKAWLQETTWHRGREDVPRQIGDETAMSKDGRIREWFN